MPTDPNDPINTLMPNTGQTAPPASKSADDNDDNIAGFNSTPSESNVWPGKPPFGEPSFSDESLTKKVENVQAETPGTTLPDTEVVKPEISVEKPPVHETRPIPETTTEVKADKPDVPEEVVEELNKVQTNVVNKTDEPEQLHAVSTIADSLTKLADDEEEDFIQEVIKEHQT